MKTTKRYIAAFTAALALVAFTSVGSVSAAEDKKPVISQETEWKTSTSPNNLFKNRRGYYDRYNDVWVYRLKVKK